MNTQSIRIEGTADDALTNLVVASTAAIPTAKCLIWRAVSEFICHRALRAAEVELNALDDRMLKDIGLERSEIKSVLLIAREELGRRHRLDRLPVAHAAAERGRVRRCATDP